MTDAIPSQRSPEDEAEVAAIRFNTFVQEATAEFFQRMQERHEMGQEKYGPVKFVEANTLNEAEEEVIDMANYAMYTYIKLRLLNLSIDRLSQSADTLGAAAFMKG